MAKQKIMWCIFPLHIFFLCRLTETSVVDVNKVSWSSSENALGEVGFSL